MHRRSCCKLLLLFTLWFAIPPLAVSAAPPKIEFTAAEQAFMQEHPIIKIGVDPKFVPFEFLSDDGTYTGIASDILNLIS